MPKVTGGWCPEWASLPSSHSSCCPGAGGLGGNITALRWAGCEVPGTVHTHRASKVKSRACGQALCLFSAWRIFSLAPILAQRRVKVRIDCPVTRGGYCLTGAGANISHLSEIKKKKKKVCDSYSLRHLQPTCGKAGGQTRQIRRVSCSSQRGTHC